MKKFKKGFTLVELVIVITVIGILASILIPTFTNIVKKANVTSDTTLVRNFNSLLATDQAANGKPSNMTEALEVVNEGGYNIEKLTPTTEGYEIAYDFNNNKFVFLDTKYELVDTELKGVSNNNNLLVFSEEDAKTTELMEDGMGVYVNYATTSISVNKSVSLDISKYGVENIDYEFDNESHIFINGDSTLIHIKAPNGSIDHYGNSGKIVIESVALESFHEYGVVGNIDLAKGRVEVLDGGQISNINITANDASTVKVENNNGQVGSVIASELSDTTTVVTGVSQDRVLDNTKTEEIEKTQKFAGGLGTKDSPYLLSTMDNFANMDIFDVEMYSGSRYFFKFINDVEYDQTKYPLNIGTYADYVIFNGEIDGNGYTLKNFNTGNKPSEDIMDISTKLNAAYFAFVGNDTVFKNLTITNTNIALLSGAGIAGHNLIFDNVNIEDTTLTSSIAASPYIYGNIFNSIEKSNINFINCMSDVDYISAAGYTAIFGANYITNKSEYSNNNMIINLEGCNYTGNYTGENVGFVMANTTGSWLNSNTSLASNIEVNMSNCQVTGSILATKNAGIICGLLTQEESATLDSDYKDKLDTKNGIMMSITKPQSLTMSSNSNNSITVSSDINDYNIKVVVTANVRSFTKDGVYIGHSYLTGIDTYEVGALNKGESLTIDMKAIIDTSNTEITGSDRDEYYVFDQTSKYIEYRLSNDFSDINIVASTRYTIVVEDLDGNMVYSQSFNYSFS